MAPALIWTYFSLVTDDGKQKLKCLKCNNLLPVPKDSSTGNMINHLKKKGHAEELKKYQLLFFLTELSHYRHNSDRPTREQDIFAWWRKNKERFPWIAKGARILLSVPGTSVSSEQTFSIAGLLYANPLRNRLSGRMAEMLILIKANLKKLRLAPSTELDDEEVGKEKKSESEESGEE